MKLGELFVQLTTKGDTKELDKTLKQLETAHKQNVIDIKTKKELTKATTEEEKALIKKNAQNEKDILNTKNAISTQKQHASSLRAVVTGFTAFVAGATIAYHAIDRMINALADANQKIINFNRQTGISMSTLNRYASASVAVNRNASLEGTAQSLQNVASNLFDIQMGRGDISPYQELAFVGGKAFNPANMSVEQVIENVREAIKGVGDIQATNIITRMGFSPDDLMMLRMSREEFEKMQGLFLDPASREALNQYGLQLKIVNLQFQLMRDKALLKIMPMFIGLTKQLLRITTLWGEFVDKVISLDVHIGHLHITFEGLAKAIGLLVIALNPLARNITIIYLIIEDIVGYFLGWDSVTGLFLDHFGEFVDKITGGIHQLNNKIKDIDTKKIDSLAKFFTASGQQEVQQMSLGEKFKTSWEGTTAMLNPNSILRALALLISQYMSGENVENRKITYIPENISPINTNNQTMNKNNVTIAQNNEFKINSNDNNVREQVVEGTKIALDYNAVMAQNAFTL